MANAEDRLAIARSVTVYIVMFVLSVAGIASAYSNYIVRPQTEEMRTEINSLKVIVQEQIAAIETLKRSNAAHFGQIKSLLKE